MMKIRRHTTTAASGRWRRHRRIRRKVIGMPDRPRITVFRSNRYIYVQFVDDVAGKTLLGCSTKDGRLKSLTQRDTLSAAQELGKIAAADATKKGISRVVFDRSGYLYHGRVKAFADAARAGGLQF